MIPYPRIDRELQTFVTNSGLHPDEVMATLTLAAARDTVPRLLDLVRAIFPDRASPVRNVEEFDHPCMPELGGILRKAGTDKSSNHNYHHLYAHILGPMRDRPAHGLPLNLFEVGLGSNNMDVVGAMGPDAKVGASLRAWRDFLPGAQIFGADVDRRILFQEDRIQTFFVDQTDPATFDALEQVLPSLDVVIDDGLHSTHANLATLRFGLRKLAPGGWIVIEDIRESSLPVWHLASVLLPPDRFESHVIYAHWGHLFVVRRIP